MKTREGWILMVGIVVYFSADLLILMCDVQANTPLILFGSFAFGLGLGKFHSNARRA